MSIEQITLMSGRNDRFEYLATGVALDGGCGECGCRGEVIMSSDESCCCFGLLAAFVMNRSKSIACGRIFSNRLRYRLMASSSQRNSIFSISMSHSRREANKSKISTFKCKSHESSKMTSNDLRMNSRTI